LAIDMLLSLDTATHHSGIALLNHGELIAELSWRSADGQTTELLPRLSQLLIWQALRPVQLRAIAVSLGPGSFTGVRVAVSTAKGMALAQGLPLIGIAALDATAYPFLHPHAVPVCAVVQAGRGRLCWALYGSAPSLLAPADNPATSPPLLEPTDSPAGQLARQSPVQNVAPLASGEEWASQQGMVAVRLGDWTGWRTPYHLTDVAALAQHITRPALFVGELTASETSALRAALGKHALLAAPAVAGRRAGVLAYLAWLRWQAGDVDDPASLSPIYLREP
jgi:tRNA threonylcarbamoyladenosine biosynthesis protein TsaB